VAPGSRPDLLNSRLFVDAIIGSSTIPSRGYWPGLFLARRSAAIFCAKAILLVHILGALHPRCAAERKLDISGAWEVSGGYNFLAKSHLWITMPMAGPPRAVLYAAYGNPQPVMVTSALLNGSRFTFSVEPLHLSYTGTLSADGDTLTGSCTVGNQSHALDFRRSIDTQPMTVHGLEQLLVAAAGKPDAEVAVQIHGKRLTERLSTTRLLSLAAKVPRPEARQALIALADSSAFLDPPDDEIPSMEKPDNSTQNQMLALARDFVARAIPRLPNFTATRTTTTYQRDLLHKQLWHAVGLSHALVSYRNGQETQRFSEFEPAPGLSTQGEFGPILSAVMRDIGKDNFAWSRWERGEKGPLAVFRYRAEAGNSHYKVENSLSGYAGEITIDPANGSIVRLALKADMESANPFLMADLMIEYGPEVLGDKTYICPKTGVALSQGLSLLLLNNVVFTNYHLFHATTRILPGVESIE
jgi:hypothetical protein